MTVRAATAADLDDVVRTFLACWYDSYERLLPPDVRSMYTVDNATELWRRTSIAEMIVSDVAGRGVLGVTRFGADRTDAPPRQRGSIAASASERGADRARSGVKKAPPRQRGSIAVSASERGADRARSGVTEPEDGHVFSLYVHPDSQGLGLGRALLDAAVDRLRQAGHHTATLWVFEDNAAARGFYTRQGWLPDGAARTEPAYRLPEIRLRRALT
jgi:ribosomal protein S18 acetylase RimI-like enzyme